MCMIVCWERSVACLPRVFQNLNELRVVDAVAVKRNRRELFPSLFLAFVQSVNGQPEPGGRELHGALPVGTESLTEPTEPSPPLWWLPLTHISLFHSSIQSFILSGVSASAMHAVLSILPSLALTSPPLAARRPSTAAPAVLATWHRQELSTHLAPLSELFLQVERGLWSLTSKFRSGLQYAVPVTWCCDRLLFSDVAGSVR